MKFLGLKIFIGILELVWFILTVPSVIMLYYVITNSEAPVPLTITVIGALVSALIVGLFFLAFAQLLNVLICIERNTAPPGSNRTFSQWRRECFQPVRLSITEEPPPTKTPTS